MPLIVSIKKQERTKVLLSMAQSFCMGLILAIYYIASTSFFFIKYDTQDLPSAFMASGCIGLVVWFIYSKVQKFASFNKLICLSLFFLIAANLFFGMFVNQDSPESYYYFSFIFIRIIVFLSAVVFWGHMGRIFSLQDGKRLFGFIGLGEVFAGMAGFFGVRFLLKILEVQHLFTLCALIYAGWLITLVISIGLFDKKSPITLAKKKDVTDKAATVSWGEMIGNKYYLILFCLALMPIFSQYFVDYLFLEQAKLHLASELPVFLAGFFGIVQLLSLIIKLFISGPFLQKMGIQYGLLSMPLLLGIVTALSCLALLIEDSKKVSLIGLFFIMMQLNRLFEKVLRGSVTEPAFQVMYQPIPKQKRDDLRLKIEGVPKAVSTIAAGFMLWILLKIGNNDPFIFTFVFLILLGFWIVLAKRGYGLYQHNLKLALNVPSKIVTKSKEIISDMNLNDVNNLPPATALKKIRLAIKLFPRQANYYFPVWLTCSHDEVKKFAIKRLSHLDSSELKQLEDSLTKNGPTFSNHSLHTYIRSLNHPTTQKEIINRLCSNEPQIRMNGIRTLHTLPQPILKNELTRLLKDPNPDVRGEAIRACGKIILPSNWNLIINYLTQPIYANAAAYSCISIGDPILPDLEQLYIKSGNDQLLLKRMVHIYESIGSPLSVVLLWKKIPDCDAGLLHELLSALLNLNAEVDDKQKELLKTILSQQAAFCAWLLSAIRDLQQNPSGYSLEQNLRQYLVNSHELIYALLSLIYDKNSMTAIRQALLSAQSSQKPSGESRDNQYVSGHFTETEAKEATMFAQELMATILKNDSAKWIPHVLDDSPIHQRLNVLNQFFPTMKLSFEMRLIDIIHKDYTEINLFTKLSAAEKLKEFNSSEAQQELAGLLYNTHFVLRGLAQNWLRQTPQSRFSKYAGQINTIPSFPKYDRDWWEASLIKMGLESNFFEHSQIAYIAKYIKTVKLKSGEFLSNSEEMTNPFCIVMEGSLQIFSNHIFLQNLSAFRLYHCMDDKDIQFKAREDTVLGILPKEILYSLLNDNRALIEPFVENVLTSYES